MITEKDTQTTAQNPPVNPMIIERKQRPILHHPENRCFKGWRYYPFFHHHVQIYKSHQATINNTIPTWI
jgi:hypothetical protein